MKTAIIGLIVGLAVGFALGFYPIKADFESYKVTQSELLNKANEQNRQLEQNLSVQKDEVINNIFKELERTGSIESDIRDTIVRMYHYIDSSNANRDTKNYSERAFRNSIRECKSLLGEGAGLLEEGSKLLRENALKHDSLIINSQH